MSGFGGRTRDSKGKRFEPGERVLYACDDASIAHRATVVSDGWSGNLTRARWVKVRFDDDRKRAEVMVSPDDLSPLGAVELLAELA